MNSPRSSGRASVVEMVRAMLPDPLNAFISPAEREQAESEGSTTLLGDFPQEVVVRITERTVMIDPAGREDRQRGMLALTHGLLETTRDQSRTEFSSPVWAKPQSLPRAPQ